MKTTSLEELAEDFDRLRVLGASEREAALAAMDPARRERLQRLLAADDDTDDPLARAVRAGAERFAGAREDRLGAYRLVRELGAGGMGTVFLADRVEGGFEQTVAIKLLRGFPTAEGLRRLRRERQILAGLDHPNIARLLDGGETRDGQPWLALEYVDGAPLLDHAARHAPTLASRLALVDAMLDAVAHAHQRLVIHRDLKPGNVLVTDSGVVKLLDFGIARLTEPENSRDTSTRVFSRGYASPEQLAGGAITTASDLYSLGVLLRELVTGRRDTADPPVEGLAPLPLDADLAGIVAKATAADPADRYASAGELKDDLDRYRRGFPVRATRITRLHRAGKFVARHRLGVAAGVGLAIALSFFVWRLAVERSRALAADAAARMALASSERDAASARASLEFLTDALSAAAPDTAMKREVSVRDLLAAARRRLDAKTLDPAATRAMNRLLAHLYGELGETKIAIEAMRRGLDGETAADRASALRLAADEDEMSRLLGEANDGAAALAAADRADALRRRYAPDDAIEQVRSLYTRALAEHRSGADARAIPILRDASTKAAAANAPPDLESDIAQTLAALLAVGEECEEAEKVASAALARLDARVAADSPERIPLLRTEASAMNTCGRSAEAEPILRRAILLQEKAIGPGGSGMMELTNELALSLNNLGRFREAYEMLERSDVAMNAIGVGGLDAAISLENYAGILESAGDYAKALDFYRRATERYEAEHVDLDHQQRRRMMRSEARTRALAGDTARAMDELTGLRARALRIDGADSVEYAMVTWQMVLVERRREHPREGLALLDEAVRLWSALVPPTHPILAHAHRYRAAFAIMQRDYASADRELAAALESFEKNDGAPIDVALVRAEIADLRAREGGAEEAREALALALPVLRDSLLPSEVNRAAAEKLAIRLGMSASARSPASG